MLPISESWHLINHSCWHSCPIGSFVKCPLSESRNITFHSILLFFSPFSQFVFEFLFFNKCLVLFSCILLSFFFHFLCFILISYFLISSAITSTVHTIEVHFSLFFWPTQFLYCFFSYWFPLYLFFFFLNQPFSIYSSFKYPLLFSVFHVSSLFLFSPLPF